MLDMARHWGVMAACAFCVTMPSSSVLAQTLVEELQDVVLSHPQIASKLNAVDSAEAGIGAAWGNYLPQVRVTADTGMEYTDSIDRINTQGTPFMRGTTGQSALTVTQHLYDGSSTSAAVGQAEVNHAISESDLRSTRQSVLLDAVSSYLAVLRWSHLIKLAGDNVHNVQDQLNLEDERIVKGSGMTLDALTAKQQLQTAKEARVRYEGELRGSMATYLQIFGHIAKPSQMREPFAPVSLLADDLDEAVSIAQERNPSVESALRSIDLSTERKRSAEAGYFPTIDLVGKGDYMHDKNAETGERHDRSMLLTLNWDLFSGWKTRSQVAQASFDHGVAMENHKLAIRKADELVRSKWEKLTTAQERMGLLENAASLAEEVLEATRKLHAVGKENIFNVLDAENRLNDARINYAQAYYDMLTACFEVLNAMGLLEFDAIERSQSVGGAVGVKVPEFLAGRP